MIAAVLMVGVFGLLIGSFLNVVAYRVPIGMSIVSPPSACPGCGNAIAPRDNVPLVSWALLRGACRHCRMSIPVRYPLVEGVTGVAFAIVAARFAPAVLGAEDWRSMTGHGLELVAYLYLAAISVALAVIDLDVRRLPHAIVLPSYAVGAVLLGAADLVLGAPGAAGLAAAGAGASVLFYFTLQQAKPGGMGGGDVTLSGVLGLFLGQLGVAELVTGTFAAFVTGGVFGAVLIAARRGRGSRAIPFGPWMLAGAWIGILAGPQLAAGYLHLVGLA